MVEVANLTWIVGPTCCFSVVCVAVVAHLILFFGTPLIHLVHFTVSCFAFPLQPRRLLQPSNYYIIAYWPDCSD